ncbi:MAG TPA: bpX6 domain-containing protein, partial [Burkholderiales bacterium]|nr:bpX6 domain-containing protein [Burkholderiales bacterium]
MIGNIRHPHLTGRQLIAGLWFPSNSHSEQETRKQVIPVWQSGATLFRFPQGNLLKLPKARLSDCEALPGWPLRQLGESLASAPFTKSEQMELPLADVWLVVGAKVTPLHFKDAQQIDPAAWIELDGYALYDTNDYSASIEPPPLATIHKRDVREVLGDAVPPPSQERSAFLMRLKAQRAVSPSASKTSSSSNDVSGVFGALAAILAPLLQAFGSASGPLRPQSNAGNIPARRETDVRPQRWREWLSRVAVITRVSRLLGWRNAAYLRRMFKLFDDGDIREALRHA